MMILRLQIPSLYLLLSTALADLGSYSGQYGVGTIDIEVPVPQPSSISNTTYLNGTIAFKVTIP
jgi:hypothetical protein